MMKPFSRKPFNREFGVLVDRAYCASSTKIACIGSSITQHAQDFSAVKMENEAKGYMTWVNALMGQRFYFANWPNNDGSFFNGSNKGVSGQKSDAILARIDSVIRMGVDICIVQNSTNEMSSDSYENIISNTTLMYERLRAVGILVVILGVLPRSTSVVAWGADSEARHKRNRVNRWKRRYAETNSGVVFVDPGKYMIDHNDPNGEPLPGMLWDGTHTSIHGAYHVARAIVEVLSLLYPALPANTYGGDDKYHATHNPTGNLVANPTFIGTSGSKGAGVTGPVPTSWKVERHTGSASTAVVSVAPKQDGSGNQLQVAITPGGGEERIYIRTGSATTTAGVFDDAWYQGELDVEVTGNCAGLLELVLVVDDQSTKGVKAADMTGYLSQTLPSDDLKLRLRTPPVETRGDAGLRYRLEIKVDGSVAGTPVIKVSHPSLVAIDSPELILNGG